MAEEKRIENRQLSREELRYGQGTVAEKGKKPDKGDTEGEKPPEHEMFGRHGKEIDGMHGRHADEMAAMHKRHASEHKDLMKRHGDERSARMSEIAKAPEGGPKKIAGEEKPKQEAAAPGKKPEPGPKPKDKSEHAAT